MCKFKKFVLTLSLFALLSATVPTLKAEENSAVIFDKEVVIFDEGIEYEIKSFGKSVGEVLKNAKIEIQKKDIVFPPISFKLDKDYSQIKIIIDRATPVILNLYGKEKEIFTHRGKVKEILEEQRIEFKKDDLINCQLEAEVFPQMEIRIWKKLTVQKKGNSRPWNTGLATWYGPGFYGRRTACGEIFTGNALTAAHRTLPCNTKVKVTNLNNGKSIIVRINDRGPYGGSIIDLSPKSKKAIGMGSNTLVRLEIVK